MRLITLTLMIGLSLLSVISMAKTNERVVYWVQVGVEGMYCRVDVNGISLRDTRRQGKITKSMGFGYEIGDFLKEGDNEIGVTAWASHERLEGFTPTCQMKIQAIVKNPDTDENEIKEVTMLYVTEDAEGNFTAKESTVYPEPSLTNTPQLETLSTRYQADATHNDLRFSRLLRVNHPHPFRWKDAEIFRDTPENRKLLWEKYDELRGIVQRKDIDTWLKSFNKIAIEDRAKYENASIKIVEGYYRPDIEKFFSLDVFEMLPCNPKDFELNIMAKGKLVQFVSKDAKYNSPVRVKVELDGKENYINFNGYFALINGELVPVIL